MKTYSVIISLLLACGTAAIGWFFFREEITNHRPKKSNTPTMSENVENTYSEAIKNEIKQAKVDAAVYNNTIQQNTSSGCSVIENSTMQSDCNDTIILKDALTSKDIDLCSSIGESGAQMKCRDAVLLEKAQEKGETKLCETLSNSENILYCKESIDEKTLQLAQESKTVSPALCETLSEKYREICTKGLIQSNETVIQKEAIRDNNLSGCDLLTITEEKHDCLDTIAFKSAMNEGKIEGCETILDNNKKEYCIKTLKSRKEIELFREYTVSNNIQGCQELVDESLKNKCNDVITLSLTRINKDKTLCDKLTNTGMISNCHKLAE